MTVSQDAKSLKPELECARCACGLTFYRKPSEHWKRDCISCWIAKKRTPRQVKRESRSPLEAVSRLKKRQGRTKELSASRRTLAILAVHAKKHMRAIAVHD